VGTISANDNTSPKTGTASCSGGSKAAGGGGIVTNNGSGTVSLTSTYPSSDTVWTVVGIRHSGSGNWTIQAYVICISTD
jgi:hypothetical protein